MKLVRRGLATIVFVASCAILAAGGAAQELAAVPDAGGPETSNEAAHSPPVTETSGQQPAPSEPADEATAPAPESSITSSHRNPLIDPELDSMIDRIAEEHGVDAHLVKGIIKVESGFNPKARSRRGACGLMQLMPATARKMGAKNVFDPAQNLQAGVKYFKHLLNRFGDVPSALAAYLRGPAAVERHGGVPKDKFTLKFIERILRYAKAFRVASMGGESISAEIAPDSKAN